MFYIKFSNALLSLVLMICLSSLPSSFAPKFSIINGLSLLLLSHLLFIFNFSPISFIFGDLLGLLSLFTLLSASIQTLKSISSKAYFTENSGYFMVFWLIGVVFHLLVSFSLPDNHIHIFFLFSVVVSFCLAYFTPDSPNLLEELEDLVSFYFRVTKVNDVNLNQKQISFLLNLSEIEANNLLEAILSEKIEIFQFLLLFDDLQSESDFQEDSTFPSEDGNKRVPVNPYFEDSSDGNHQKSQISSTFQDFEKFSRSDNVAVVLARYHHLQAQKRNQCGQKILNIKYNKGEYNTRDIKDFEKGVGNRRESVSVDLHRTIPSVSLGTRMGFYMDSLNSNKKSRQDSENISKNQDESQVSKEFKKSEKMRGDYYSKKSKLNGIENQIGSASSKFRQTLDFNILPKEGRNCTAEQRITTIHQLKKIYMQHRTKVLIRTCFYTLSLFCLLFTSLECIIFQPINSLNLVINHQMLLKLILMLTSFLIAHVSRNLFSPQKFIFFRILILIFNLICLIIFQIYSESFENSKMKMMPKPIITFEQLALVSLFCVLGLMLPSPSIDYLFFANNFKHSRLTVFSIAFLSGGISIGAYYLCYVDEFSGLGIVSATASIHLISCLFQIFG